MTALEHPGALELIDRITYDGDTEMAITTDSAGQPLKLSRAVLRIKMGTVAAAGSIAIDAKYNGATIGRWYSGLQAATGHTGMFYVWQDGSFWDSQFTAIANNVGTLYKQPAFTLLPVGRYPYINAVEAGIGARVKPPAGTVVEIYGVRA